jgi:hypothetical protein
MMLPSFALAFGGFTALCLSMDRHQRDVFGRKLPSLPSRWLRILGWVVLGASLVTCTVGQGWALGTVLWCGVLTAAAGLLVLIISYAARIVAAAGILMLAGALVMLCAGAIGTGSG